MTANAESQSHTGVPKIDGLFSGVKWDTLNLSYSFPTAAQYLPMESVEQS